MLQLAGRYSPALKALIFVPFLLVISSWFTGWEAIYRPTSDAPVISLFTALGFVLLFHISLYAKDTHDVSDFALRAKYMSFGLLISLLLSELAMHIAGIQLLFGKFPVSSLPTLVAFAAFTFYEFLLMTRSKATILADVALLSGLAWVYLASLGHVLDLFYLTGALTNSSIGLSIPTATGFTIYLLLAGETDQHTISKKLYKSTNWVRNIILYFLAALAILPILFVLLLEYTISNAAVTQTAVMEMVLFFVSVLLVSYIVCIMQLSFTHSKFQAICSYTNQLRDGEGNWITIEKFLSNNYGLDITHGISDEGKAVLEKEMESYR